MRVRVEFFLLMIGTVIWGMFSELKHGEIGLFIGRLIFVAVVILGVDRIFKSKNNGSTPTP